MYENEEPEEPMFITKEMLVEEKIIKNEDKIELEEIANYLPVFTIIIIAVNIAAFIWEAVTGALTGKEEIIKAGALYRPNVENGEYFRILSSMFLHGSVSHLLNNMIVFYILGITFERFFSVQKAAAIYFIAGITGAFLSLSFSTSPSVGASGAIFGVMGADIYYLIKYRSCFEKTNRRIGNVLILVAIFSISAGFLQTYIDNYAHIGGFLGGVLSAVLLGGKDAVTMKYKVAEESIRGAGKIENWKMRWEYRRQMNRK